MSFGFMPCFEGIHGTLCVASSAQYIIYTSKLAVRVKFEGIFIQTCEVYRLISLISQMLSQNSEEQQQDAGCSW